MTNVATYCKESLSAYPPYELSHFNDSDSYTEAPKHYENMDLENFVVEKVNKEIEARNVVDEKLSFHNHAPKALVRSIEGIFLWYICRSKIISVCIGKD